MITRKEHLDANNAAATSEERARLHREYYAQFVGGAEKQRVRDRFPLNVLRASFEQDRHFNTDATPLKAWDMLAIPISARATKLLRECGDYPTLCDGVCIVKEAARQIIEESQ